MTEEKTIQDLEKEFYSKPLSLSYSGLSKMMYSPQLYYNHYVLQKREEKIESYLVDGKVIHCLLLDNGSFDEQFMMLPSNLPTGNSRLVIDKVFEKHKEHILSSFGTIGTLDDFGKDILDILKEINLHQALKTDAQRFAKIITEETTTYFEFLKSKGNKTLLDDETLKRCTEAVDILRSNVHVSYLLGLHANDFNNVEIHNEKEFRCSTRFCDLHGIIDNIHIDHDNRNITINDLKTSGKTLSDFKETIEFYNYWVQAAIYWTLVQDNFKDLISKGYTVQFHFIVIDKYNQVYAFPVSMSTMINWCVELHVKLEHAMWYYNNKNYSSPYEFARRLVTL
jgi:hypothetical protein